MKHKIFKIVYADGKYHYVVSYKSWVGLVPFINSVRADCLEDIHVREASIWELIKYIIKGV